MMETKIEWTNETWNPVTGCTPISEGCRNCYAKRMSKRLAGRFGYPQDEPFKLTYHPNIITRPLQWRKSRCIFVCSMGDLFHIDSHREWIDEVFATILACSYLNNYNHTFQILTKRPELMLEYLSEDSVETVKRLSKVADGLVTLDNPDIYFSEALEGFCWNHWDENRRAIDEGSPWNAIKNIWPLKNLHLGVSVDNQATADERIPLLLQAPAAKRFVSFEPLLGPIDLFDCGAVEGDSCSDVDPQSPSLGFNKGLLDQVIVGAETGPGKRPMDLDWARSIRDQCQEANVPFFFKRDSNGNHELDGEVHEGMMGETNDV